MESRLAEGVDPPSASAHSEQGNLSKTELNINLEKRKLERRSGPGQPRRNTSNRPTPVKFALRQTKWATMRQNTKRPVTFHSKPLKHAACCE
ncbi:hypothetical protein MHYP_G00182220 [Metynnis hypsauchen]